MCWLIRCIFKRRGRITMFNRAQAGSILVQCDVYLVSSEGVFGPFFYNYSKGLFRVCNRKARVTKNTLGSGNLFSRCQLASYLLPVPYGHGMDSKESIVAWSVICESSGSRSLSACMVSLSGTLMFVIR
jgi:hypothetical protein